MKNFKFNILCIDDAKTSLLAIQMMFQENDSINIITALSAKEAFKILSTNKNIHLILLDIQMPEIDGFETANILKSDKSTMQIPIIFITATFQSEEFITRGYDIGAIDYLLKPIEKHNFIQKVNQYKLLFEQQEIILSQSRLVQMGELISMIAHQWKQPLSVIATIMTSIKIKSELDIFNLPNIKEVKEYESYVNESTDTIQVQVQNLSVIIDDFRHFYNPNKQKVLMSLEDISNKSLQIIGTSIKQHNIEIIEEYQEQIQIELYNNEVMQVIINILKNAQDNLLEKNISNPYIKISSIGKSISICDNGGGIADDIIDKIFDPYFSTKSEKNGTGLGLYMSKTIVQEHHDAKLLVENIDDGVCFTIQFNQE